MLSFGMLRHVALVRTDILEALRSSKTSVLTRAIRCITPEDGILHSHCHKTLKSYKEFNNVYFSPNSAWLIKLSRIWVRHVAHVRQMGSVYNISVSNHNGKHCGNMVWKSAPNFTMLFLYGHKDKNFL
jgi:hypothetical protein